MGPTSFVLKCVSERELTVVFRENETQSRVHARVGRPQWLPARVMSDLPRWHTQRCGRCQNSRYPYGQTRALPLSSTRRLRVRHERHRAQSCAIALRSERHRAQSCAIALRSPAPERSSDLKRYSPDIHVLVLVTHVCALSASKFLSLNVGLLCGAALAVLAV
jgi:hypothetical protein